MEKASSTPNTQQLSIVISPPVIVPWLSSYDRERHLVSVDFDMDVLTNQSYRVDIDVGFNCVCIKSGAFVPRTFFIGSTGAQVELVLSNGNVIRFTDSQDLPVNYSTTIVRRRLSSIKIMPEKIMQDKGIGSIEYGTQLEHSKTATFSCNERMLSSLHQHHAIKWLIDLPKGHQVVRDFLFGNLYLYAECEWYGKDRVGKVIIKAANVRLFDSDRQVTGPAVSLTSRYILWRDRKSKQIEDKVCFQFTQME